jgi:hypothetical protein
MLKRYPDTLRWRQALPPLFVLSLISLLLFSILRSAFLFVLGIELAVYFAIMILAGIHAAARLRLFELILGLPLSIFIMHISWGSGFLWGILRSGLNRHG